MEQEQDENVAAKVVPFPSRDAMAPFSAATSGHEEARLHYMIGLMYEFGRGVEPNLAEAIAHYRRAAKAGLAQAQNSLGFLYSLGQGIERDHEQACKWLSRAAMQGHTGAQMNLGLVYCAGRGVAKNEPLGVYWFHEAAKGGNQQAQDLLAQAYEQGWYGLSPNSREAAYWSNRASNA
jgi:TPR repeat protein